MTTFRYRAVQLDGATVEGTVDALDRRGALRALSQKGLHPFLF